MIQETGYIDGGHLSGEDKIPDKAFPVGAKVEPTMVLDNPDSLGVSVEVGLAATEMAVKKFREIFAGLDYTILSSTALYLRNTDIGKVSSRAPGDFDCLVFSEAALKSAVDRLKRAGAVFLERDGETEIERNSPVRIMPDHEAKVVSGYLLENVGENIRYDFEVFFQTQVAPQEKISRRTADNILTREGLQLQYGENWRMERQISAKADSLIVFLLEERENLGKAEIGEAERQILEKISLSPEELKEFYILADKDDVINLFSDRFLMEADYRQEILTSLNLDEKGVAKFNSLIDQRNKIGPQTKKFLRNEVVNLLSGGFKEKELERARKLEDLRVDTAMSVGSDLSAGVVGVSDKIIDVEASPIASRKEKPVPKVLPRIPRPADPNVGLGV